MRSGFVGAFVGLIVGLVVGTALFGPLGAIVGIVLGPIVGFFIVTPVAVSSVKLAAKKPITVTCPETHEDVQITLDPKDAAHAEMWNQKKHIETCTRFDGPVDCEEECLTQVDL
jgi:hypothetical protein